MAGCGSPKTRVLPARTYSLVREVSAHIALEQGSQRAAQATGEVAGSQSSKELGLSVGWVIWAVLGRGWAHSRGEVVSDVWWFRHRGTLGS